MVYENLLNGVKGDKLFLLGNEAAVRGALEAGVGIAATYPGTPSSEIGNILSSIAKRAGLYFEFSANEKVAMEVAATGAVSNLRSFTFMKHVGMNVASDSAMTTAYSGVDAGMVILVADDPSTFSSQNEQDTRNFARQANIPVLEPSNPQEVKDMMVFGYQLSEELKLPVILRTTTRVSHMRGPVELGDIPKFDKNIREGEYWQRGHFNKNPSQFVPVPANALDMHTVLVNKIDELEEYAFECELNRVFEFNDINTEVDLHGEFGVISSSSAFNYAYDVVNNDNLGMDILKLGLSYPLSEDLILDFVRDLDGVFIVEEVDPIIEREVLAIIGENGLDIPVYGKKNGIFPQVHEYSQDIVKESFDMVLGYDGVEKIELSEDIKDLIDSIPNRQPTLCAGCSHRSAYYCVNKAVEELGISLDDVIFASDIGCYTLGISPPYNAADYLLSMGSSIGDGCGFSKATDQYICSFIGDSTFFHSGISPLLNAVHNKNKFVVTILDNRITAMTGGQPNPGLPVDGVFDEAPAIDIFKIVEAIGVDFVRTVNPHQIRKTIDVYKEALEFDGVSVIITQYPCTLIKGVKRGRPMCVGDNCTHCLKCVSELACPAISIMDGKVTIDSNACFGCTDCVQICPEHAIRVCKKV